MARQWKKIGGLLALGLMVGSGVLGGCGANQKDFNALKQENEDLRTKMATLETENNANVNRVKELEGQQGPITTGSATPTKASRKPTGGGGQDVVLEIAGDVLFDPGQATIKSTARKELDRIVSLLKGKYAGHNIRVEGHTDSDPIKKAKFPSNEALSEARAQSVRDYLTNKGVSGRQLTVVGFGASKPKATKKESRRVDIVVLAE